MLQNVRFGVRLLRKSPAFSITAIAIVTLAIGTATAIFSVVYGVMLKPLPFREPERLVSVWLQWKVGRTLPAAADAYDLRQRRGVFEDVALFENANLNLVGEEEPQRLQGASVSPNLFSVLGVSAAWAGPSRLTRIRRGAIASCPDDGLWQSRFGGTARSSADRSPQRIAEHDHWCLPPDFQYRPGTTGLGAARPRARRAHARGDRQLSVIGRTRRARNAGPGAPRGSALAARWRRLLRANKARA